MTVEQQVAQYDTVDKYDYKLLNMVRYWNREVDSMEEVAGRGIQLMTYDKLIYTLINRNHEGLETLGRVKIIVLDECHVLFSDLFVQNIEAAKVWLRDIIYSGNKVIIGMTATPGIIQFYKKSWGVPIQQVNKIPIVNYKARRLICTDFKTIPYIITSNKIMGRTLIMCQSVQDCYSLQRNLSNAAVLVSKNNKEYTKSMEFIRNYIIEHESLPEMFQYPLGNDKYETRRLEVLICTSTAREGFNLREDSGVRNVICCFPDELHITQFAGRCRFSLDSIVVVNQSVRSDNYGASIYLAQQHQGFKEFMKQSNKMAWFRTISHLTEATFKDIEYVIMDMDGAEFINYINKKWLVPIGALDVEKYKIWRDCDKKEILAKAKETTFSKYKRDKLTFPGVIRIMKNDLGYDVESGRLRTEDKRYTYKLVVGFDTNSSTCKEENKDIISQ